MELSLDNATWDLYLDETGNIATVGEADFPALLSQRITHRLQTFKGECFLDREIGVPYYEEILKKNPDLGRIRSLLSSVISSVDGVDKILSLDLSFDRKTRLLSVTFRVLGQDGSIATGEV